MLDTSDPLSDSGERALAEAAVQFVVLSEYPELLTVFELAVRINQVQVFDRFDAVERAIVELVGRGELWCRGARVVPGSWV